MTAAIETRQLTHRYGNRLALSDLTITIPRGSIFVFLGPNGGGKTTLFRILSTLISPQAGTVTMLGSDVVADTMSVRRQIGVVFQAPSLDKKLTVLENLYYQAAMYGVPRELFRRRSQQLVSQLGLNDRINERTETLSGGLRRRVELAKGMIHAPQLMLMDEPSTGLDPGGRSDLWQYLQLLREESGVTIVLTSHLLDEADRADRIAILHQGKLVAEDTPAALRDSVGGDSVTIDTQRPQELAAIITDKFACPTEVVSNQIRLEQPDGHKLIPQLVEAFPDQIEAIKLGKPTLEDVFIAKTGHRFWTAAGDNDVN
ncbi:MAG: ABC transporter ATP-binding protein [Gammaproteobacteria bacterium]|nr:ABC transporter ATP-binding protein [Gammaproteobacteria bacterium]